MAKYNYRANPDEPGGFKELDMKQGEKLRLIRRGHAETRNPLWWQVSNEKGEIGFVPGNYCMVNEILLSYLKPFDTNVSLSDALNNSLW